jgi:hypothetical protein
MIETAVPKRTRVRRSAAERAEWLNLFRASGQTAAEFCRGNDIAYATLSLWIRQSAVSEAGELIEVPAAILGSAFNAAAMHVHLPYGVRLEVVPGTDPAWLAQLLRAVSPVEA